MTTHLDPGKGRRYLHVFHLLLSLGVEVQREFSGLLVISPAVVVLRRRGMVRVADKGDRRTYV